MIKISANLQKNKVTSQRYVLLNTNSGQLTLPNFSNLVLGGFSGGADSLLVTTLNSYPTGINAVDNNNDPIVVSLDSLGNFSFNTPIAYPVALVYQVEQFLKDYNPSDSDIINLFHADINQKLSQKLIVINNTILANTILNVNNSSLNYTVSGDTTNLTASSSVFNNEERYQVYRNGQMLRKNVDVIYVSSSNLYFNFDLASEEEILIIT
jgi:hypothetical protein